MKKFVAILLALVIVSVSVTTVACNFLLGGHKHDFGDSYFMYVKCSHDFCIVYGRNTGKRKYDGMYNFNTAKKNEITSHYNSCTSNLNNGNDLNTFVELHTQLEEDLNYLNGQYYWASIYYDQGKLSNINNLTDFYDDMFSKFCKMYETIDTVYEDFWSTYSESREDCLEMAKLYGDNSNNRELNDILDDYYDAIDSENVNMTTLNNLYSRLVVTNNNIAQDSGYDNYMDYAYDKIYNREYSPSQVATMRNYVKTYIAPALVTVYQKLYSKMKYDKFYQDYYFDFSNYADSAFYYGLMGESIFEDKGYEYFSEVREAVNLIGNYFKYLTSTTAGNKKIDFYSAVNNVFKNGNYFTGTGDGAYTVWIPNNQLSTMYFQRSDDNTFGYDTAFTFVHEFGHYYENIHNGGLQLSYDHDETQSQGDEMLFLAWLKNNLPKGVSSGFEAVELEQLANMLGAIVLSCAVDEFEQAAYTGTWNGQAVSGNYDTLFENILKTYGNTYQYLNSEYWAYVVFDSAGYYISYAMSALPSVEIYTMAHTSGLDIARDAYFKLFTYCEDITRMSNYNYANVLKYCGFGSPFEQNIYTHISNYVSKL